MGTPGPLELRRTLHADPAEVFRAWVDPERLARWLAPGLDFEVTAVEADARPGGAWSVDFRVPAGAAGRVAGTYDELEAPRRLASSLSLSWEGTPGRPTRLELELAPSSAATELCLRHHGLSDEGERTAFEEAWALCLARLPTAFDEAAARFFARLEEYPRFRSRFGGFWTDLTDVEQRIAGKLELGVLDAEEAAAFRRWAERGYASLPQAVPAAAIDRLQEELDLLWQHGHAEMRIETFTGRVRRFAPRAARYREQPHQVLDLHGYSAAARDVVFAPAVQRFLELLFERPPLAFQSLLFTYGTEQELHQDTAYVVLRSPMEFVGCWIALEDVQPGSGELQYYEGSHRIPEHLWLGRARAKPYDLEDERDFLRWVAEEPARRGLPLVRFAPRKGDVFLWHADLVHGGAPVERRGTTRRSLVTHLCPRDVDPEYFGTVDHSPKLRHGPRSYYCYRRR